MNPVTPLLSRSLTPATEDDRLKLEQPLQDR